MNRPDRIVSIDIMRGITVFLMLFVNDLYVPGVPRWLVHTSADFDGMGLTDWVFPGFLFMVGMSVPFAIDGRFRTGETVLKILIHIVIRTISLLLIGVLMYNIGRLNPDLSGISRNLWAILLLLCVFLIWNRYSDTNKWLKIGLRAAGLTGLLVIAILFRSGTFDNPGWMKTGWWGILGLIGWGYVSGAVTYMIVRDNLLITGLVTLFFLAVNSLSQLKLLEFMNFVKPVFGVIKEGNIPFIVLSGVFTSLVLKNIALRSGRKPAIIFITGVLVFGCGFIFRNWFIISKIKGTPSWGLICTGISMMLFSVIYLFSDILKNPVRLKLFGIAGRNSLTVYLAPDVLYYLIWMLNLPVFVYKQKEFQLVAVAGSLLWAFAMLWVGRLLSRAGVQLKL